MLKINYDFYDEKDIYNDGDIENELLDIYGNEKEITENKNGFFFYTSSIRENIINWYPFKSDSTVLEVGAGLGCVTSALCDKCKKVVSVEGSKRRAEVIAARHKNRKNLDIYCGNLNDMTFKEKFDHIVLIGVFEYAKIFCNTKNPFIDFLNNLKKLLKPDGKILIAIENRYGIKYWAGLSEDHFKNPYVGIEGYDNGKNAQTFGKKELEILFESVKLKNKFYYVFPDYKMPEVVFTDNYLPSVKSSKLLSSFNYYSDDSLFSINEALKGIILNDKIDFFANSFLIELSNEEKNLSNIDMVKFQNYRNKKYQAMTVISNKKAYKKMLTDKESDHLLTLKNTHEMLNNNNIASCKIYDDYSMEYIEGKSVLKIIEEELYKNNYEIVIKEIDNFVEYLNKIAKECTLKNPYIAELKTIYEKAKILPVGLFDLHLDNIIFDKGNYVMIDQEWVTEKQLPIEYNIYISLNVLYDSLPEINNITSIYELYDKYNLDEEKRKIFELCRHRFFEQENSVIDYENKDYLNKMSFYDIVNVKKIKNDAREVGENYKIAYENIINSNSWKVTSPFRNGKKNIKAYKSKTKQAAVLTLKKIYKIFPLPTSQKRKILDKLESKSSLVKRIRRSSYKNISYVESRCDEVVPFNSSLSNIRKKIAIHAHVYYIDLIDEFVSYFKNIPYEFDLFVSVANEENIDIVKGKCKSIEKLNNLKVKKCINIGRDFSPMFVEFGKELQNYDYICHIHTKKSVRTGSEQDGWRKHLIGSVLGSEEIIKSILYQFETKEKIGLIFPETYKDMPYWAHTYLQNESMCRSLAATFGAHPPEEYFDYSVGSFFWSKGKALEKLFSMNLTYKDFGEEKGKDDGTFAHAIERMLPTCAMSSGYDYYVIDCDNKIFKSSGNKNLWQYCNQTYESALAYAKEHNEITFDIFDTLITRVVYRPYDIMNILENELREKHNIDLKNFGELRSRAEYNVRVSKKFIDDVSIDEIYEEIKKLTSLSQKDIYTIESLEKELEIKYCIPRKKMLELFNELKQSNKKIILISDMYLDSKTITKMLNKCGYYDWNEMLILCEVNKRKDNGTMWDYFFEKERNSVHFGDNEKSDIQAVSDRKHAFVHVMQGNKIFKNTNYGRKLNLDIEQLTIEDSITFGLLTNKKMFNNPFRKDFNIVINNYNEFGYSFIGPVLFKYFSWLHEKANENKNDLLLFLAREGYYFEKLYKDFCRAKNIKPIKHKYFLASRRAVTVAAIEDINDVEDLLTKYYTGSISNLFKSRLGYDYKGSDKNIELPKDLQIVMDIFKGIEKEYFKSIKNEKNEYNNYVETITKGYKNIAVVDLGYSGTIQYYLSKLRNEKYSGYYLITEADLKVTKLGCKVYSCFDLHNTKDYEDQLIRNSLILESFLTAPYGQLINFSNGEPQYKDDILSNKDLENLELIYSGVKEFFEDILNYLPNAKYENINSKLICKSFYELVDVDNIMPKELEKAFVLEDQYCSNQILHIFDLLKSRNKQ